MFKAMLVTVTLIVLVLATWKWFLAAVALAAALWGLNRWGNRSANRKWRQNLKQDALVHRADRQHRAIVLDGDEDYGTHGVYPPAV